MGPDNTNAILLQNTVVVLLQNYKFTTADKSQVCDGSNWETFRTVRMRQMEATEITKTLQTQIKMKKTTQTQYGYHPVRRDSSSRLKETTQIPIVASRELLRRDESQSSFIPRASFSDNDDEFGFLDMSEPSQKPQIDIETELFNGIPQQPQVQVVHKRASVDTDTELLNNTPQQQQVVAHKRASDSDICTQRSQPSRRHSTSSRPERRASSGDGSYNTSGSKSVCRRRLSKPMHRCSITNQSVSGIMRPARYSSNNLAAMNSPTNDLPGLTPSSSYSSGLDMQRVGMKNSTSCMNFAAEPFVAPTWVAHGVGFAKSMEVYEFRK